jgi:hypothetical protein
LRNTDGKAALSEPKHRDRLNSGTFFPDNVLANDPEIGDGILNIFRNVVIAKGKNVEVEVPAG